MSWYKNPQLFIQSGLHDTYIYECNQELSVGTTSLSEERFYDPKKCSFPKHLSLGNNEENDYEVFFADLRNRPVYTMINSQGLAATYNDDVYSFILSREPPNSPFYSLPGIQPAAYVEGQDQQRADEKSTACVKIVSDLEIASTLEDKEKKWKAEVSDLQEQLQREKTERLAERQAHENHIFELTSKLKEICVVGGESINMKNHA